MRIFQCGETIGCWSYNKDWAGAFQTPDNGVKVTITDPDGIIKVSAISVLASASFTIGLTVTGGTSKATGIVIAKPDATTLWLKNVTGIWQSGETITDTGTGTSTTSSILTGAAMTLSVAGKFVYYYNSQLTDTVGWWTFMCISQDGVGDAAKYTRTDGGFQLQ